MPKQWIILEAVLHRARSPVDPADAARALKEAGAHVTRNSRAQWMVSRGDPVARDWLIALWTGTWTPPEPAPEPDREPSRRTGGHVFPLPSRRPSSHTGYG